MENTENTRSLRDVIEAGFERVSAEENADAQQNPTGTPEANEQMATEETPQVDETPAQAAGNEPALEAVHEPQSNLAGNDVMSAALQMIRSLREENSRLNQMVSQQGNAMAQQSQLAEKAAEQTVTEPEIPQIDFSQLQYMGDEERQAAITAWQNAIAENAAAKMRAEFEPVRADFEAKSRMAAENAARTQIFSDPRFADFEQNAQDIERIAAADLFKNVSPEQKYLYSGLIARGMKHDPAAKPTTDEIVQMVMSNPDALKAIETRRAQETRDKNNSLPVITASSGMTNANPVPENRVRSKEELESRINKRFGL